MKRILRHVGGKDFRKTHQRHLDEQRAFYLERREREIEEQLYLEEIERLSQPYKSDWRSDINEGMTSSDLMQTTLGSQGNAILDTTTWANYGGDATDKTTGFGGGTITISGDTDPEYQNGGIIGFPINVQRYDTLLVDVTTDGTRFYMYGSSANGYPLYVDTTSSGTYTINISNESDTSTWLIFTTGSGTVTVSNPRFQRRAPISIIVGLDDPEATNFIRTDPVMRGLSAQERRKKLEDMLDAGDEYMLKQLGLQGSKARPADTGNVRSWEQASQASDDKLPYDTSPDASRPGGATRDNYNMKWDKHMQQWVPNINPLIKKASARPADTQIAGTATIPTYPGYGFRGRYDQFGREIDPKTGKPVQTPMSPPVKQANKKNKVQIAHHEPQGQVLSEKKLKSPNEVMSKIPGYYDGKPSPLGFPMEPPPKMVNGMHPDLVDGKKVADRFNRLDPQSARSMPSTGNPHIDKKVRAAAKKPK